MDIDYLKGLFSKASIIFGSLILIIQGLTGCQHRPSLDTQNVMKVVATTSIVGDIVSQVGGEKVLVTVLLPPGADPHGFSPTPRDASNIVDAIILFENGVGLEEFLKPLLDNIGGTEKIVEVSIGIKYRTIIEADAASNQPVDDPHTWMDPNNVIIWVDTIVHALSEKDPDNAAYYRRNGQAYQEKLRQLDHWIRMKVAEIPEQNRMIVTEHLIFGYFADQYGFTQVGAIVPGFSSLAEPSAQDIARLEDDIRRIGVKAIFVNAGVNANIAERISSDTGTKLVFLYMESLSDKDKGADNYLDFMSYDITKIAEALK